MRYYVPSSKQHLTFRSANRMDRPRRSNTVFHISSCVFSTNETLLKNIMWLSTKYIVSNKLYRVPSNGNVEREYSVNRYRALYRRRGSELRRPEGYFRGDGDACSTDRTPYADVSGAGRTERPPLECLFVLVVTMATTFEPVFTFRTDEEEEEEAPEARTYATEITTIIIVPPKVRLRAATTRRPTTQSIL